jgi:hypothetical protein
MTNTIPERVVFKNYGDNIIITPYNGSTSEIKNNMVLTPKSWVINPLGCYEKLTDGEI